MTPITRRRAEAAALVWLLAAAPAAALDLPLPEGAVPKIEETEAATTYRLPVGPWQREGGVPFDRIDGTVTRQVWQLPGSERTTLEILTPLRASVEAAGYAVRLDCETAGCGGFDFRFGIEVLPAPAMYVNLADFRVLSAEAPSGAVLNLLVSRNRGGGYIQSIRAEPDAARGPAPANAATPEAQTVSLPGSAPQATPAATPAHEVTERLAAAGHVVLADLRFDSGAATLGDGPVASLDAIATYLEGAPGRRVLFVGHTDATGSLEANVALSRRRAAAAVSYLRQSHGTPARQVAFDGAGYLAPVASNLTEAGRVQNRRVEAVLLPAE